MMLCSRCSVGSSSIASLPDNQSWAFQVCHLCTSSCCSWALIACWPINWGDLPSTGYKDWLEPEWRISSAEAQPTDTHWVFLLSMSLVEVVLGPPGKCRPRSTATYKLPGAIRHELQSSLKMIATCAEFGGGHERSCCQPRLVATSARPGTT